MNYIVKVLLKNVPLYLLAGLAGVVIAVVLGLPLIGTWPLLPSVVLGMVIATMTLLWDGTRWGKRWQNYIEQKGAEL